MRIASAFSHAIVQGDGVGWGGGRAIDAATGRMGSLTVPRNEAVEISCWIHMGKLKKKKLSACDFFFLLFLC